MFDHGDTRPTTAFVLVTGWKFSRHFVRSGFEHRVKASFCVADELRLPWYSGQLDFCALDRRSPGDATLPGNLGRCRSRPNEAEVLDIGCGVGLPLQVGAAVADIRSVEARGHDEVSLPNNGRIVAAAKRPRSRKTVVI
jgi:hypothetical protein